MFKKPSIRVQLMVSLLLVSIAGLAQNTENALLWEISGKKLKKPSYLFGTYHLLTESYFNDVPKAKSLMEKADGVAVEMEIDSSKLPNMQAAMFMNDKTISQLISKEDAELVSKELQSVFGAPLAAFDRFKPTSITLLLTLMYAQKENQDVLAKYTGSPLDVAIATKARNAGKSVFTFETMDEQINILYNSLSIEEQARQLVVFMKRKDDMVRSQRDLLNAYMNQDMGKLLADFEQYEKDFGSSAYMLDDRNVRWMEKMGELLSKGNQFIAVGALHLQGKKGLVSLLREQGYTVKAVKVK